MIARLSLRARLVAGIAVLVSAGLITANVIGVVLLRSYLLERVDQQVAGFGGPGAGSGEAPEPPTGTTGPCANPRDPQGLRSDFAVLVLDGSGAIQCSLGPDLGDAGPDLDQIPEGLSGVTTVSAVDGSQDWRIRAVEPESATGRVVFAVSLAEADATVRRMVALSSVISLLTLLVIGLASWAITRVGLRPLTHIEHTAERIAAGDLSERVSGVHGGGEVASLAGSINSMLSQVESAFTARAHSEATLRRFVSDASHELRTPVATIRGHAEMWRTGVSTDVDSLMSRIESESIRVGGLVEDMLLLARFDRERPLEIQPIDMLSLATDAVVDAQSSQPGRPIELEAEVGDRPPVVAGDEARLRQVLGNLLTNALTHTPPDTAVLVRVVTTDDEVIVQVVDVGQGMTAEEKVRVFDRFYRANRAHSIDPTGSGLGLAIVKSLIEAHDGTVSCDSTPGVGTVFELRLALAS